MLRWSGQWSESMVRSVVWSVVRLAVRSVVRPPTWPAVVRSVVLQMPGHRSRKRSFPCRGFRVFARSGAAVVLQCCGKVVGHGPSRWSGRWSSRRCGPMTDGPVGDPVGDPVGGPVGGLVGGPVCGLVDGPVCGPVRAVCCPVETRPAQYSGLPASVGKRACVLMFPNSGGQLGVQYNYILQSQSVTALAADSGFSHGPVRGGFVLRKGLRWRSCQYSPSRWSGRWSSGGPVGGPVGSPAGCPVIDLVSELVGDLVGGLVGGPVCGLVDGAVDGPVRAVCGPGETRLTSYSLQWPAGFRCLDIGRPSRGFRVSHGLVLRWCCSVAGELRWCCGGPVSGPSRWSGRRSGRWYCPMVRLAARSVVRSVVWPVVQLWSGPCGLLSVETRPAPYNGLPASNAWILVARGLCSFVTFVILRNPDPGPGTLCPQNVVRAASWRRLWGSRQVHAAIVSEVIAFLSAWLSRYFGHPGVHAGLCFNFLAFEAFVGASAHSRFPVVWKGFFWRPAQAS